MPFQPSPDICQPMWGRRNRQAVPPALDRAKLSSNGLASYLCLDLSPRSHAHQIKKAPLPGPCVAVDVYTLKTGCCRTTSFSSEQLSFSRQLSWLRSSSIDSPYSNLRFKKSQRDSYIESLRSNVKKKMHLRRTTNDPGRRRCRRDGAMLVKESFA